MIEKQIINESQFQHKDATPAPEREKEGKLSKLNPLDLIPAEFANIPIVTGQLNVVIKKSDGHINYVITDEGKMSLAQIENGFTYLDEENLKEYSKLKRGKNQYARPLVHGSINEISPDIIFEGMLETNPVLRGKGAGVVFLKHIDNLAKSLGYKFLAGYQNNAEVARFFLKRGRYLLEEIKDELQTEFQVLHNEESDKTVFYTIKFLDPEDVARYVKPERIDTDIENKIEFKEKILTLGDVFGKLLELLKNVEKNKEEVGDRATLIEIMEDLNQMLPENSQYDLPKLSEDDDNLFLNLKVLLEHLKSKSSILIREATLDELKKNIV